MKNFAGFSISIIKKEKKTVCFSCRASNYNLLLIFTCLFSKERERNRDKSLNYRFFFAINNKKRSLVCALFCCKVRRKGMGHKRSALLLIKTNYMSKANNNVVSREMCAP